MATLCASLSLRAARGFWSLPPAPERELQPAGPESAAGPESEELTRKLREALRHFCGSAEVRAALGTEEHEIEYRPMPPKRTFQMTVDLRVRGRGRPVRYRPDPDLEG